MAAAPSMPRALAAVSAAMALRTMWAPGALMRKAISRSSIWASTSVPSWSGCMAMIWAMPNVSMRAARGARRPSMALSAGSTATPSAARPSPMALFSSAIASRLPKWPICAASTAVITATSGLTSRESGRISPGRLVPSSATQNARPAGMRARVSGTPHWLL